LYQKGEKLGRERGIEFLSMDNLNEKREHLNFYCEKLKREKFS